MSFEALIAQICLSGGRAEALDGSSSAAIAIICAPHVALNTGPAGFVADCLVKAKGFVCGRPEIGLHIKSGVQTLVVVPEGVSFSQAMRIARFAGVEHSITFNGRDLAAMMHRPCRVKFMGKGAFQGAADYTLTCGQRGVVITEDCAASRCRLFPARLSDLADEI